MRHAFRCLPAVLVLSVSIHAQPSAGFIDAPLQTALERLAESFDGRVGIYVHHLGSGATASVAADSLFPTASMIKVPLLVRLFDLIEKDSLDYHATWTYADSLHYPGVDILASFKPGESITISKLAMLMITTSDNTASLWIQQEVGGGQAVNRWFAENGFEHTRVNSRTPGRQAAYDAYGWGQTTPREMAQLLVGIRYGRIVSPAASEEMYRILTRIYWNDEALSRIPPTVQVASKQGAVSRSKSEVVLVNAPHGDYVFCVITDDQAEAGYEADNAGYLLIRQVSELVWNHLEPEWRWQPAEGMERYWE